MKNIDFGLTERDLEILELMANFGGKTFVYVLAHTFWANAKKAEQQVRNRLRKLSNKKIIRYMSTNLNYPKNAVVLTESGKNFVDDYFGIKIHSISLSAVTTWHTIYEQISFYWLKILGKNVERTIVAKWRENHNHTPDLVYQNNKGKNVYVEIELNKKRPDRYIEIFNKMQADDVGAVLYVFENDQKMKTLGKKIPIWDKINYITIDKLIEGGKNGKLLAIKQSEFLKNLE